MKINKNKKNKTSKPIDTLHKIEDVSCYALSELALAKDWMTEEEDEFWKDL